MYDIRASSYGAPRAATEHFCPPLLITVKSVREWRLGGSYIPTIRSQRRATGTYSSAGPLSFVFPCPVPPRRATHQIVSVGSDRKE